MKQTEFLKAVTELEASCRTPWKKNPEYLEERRHRRVAVFRAVRGFPDEVVREAFQTLADEVDAFPSVHEIVDACRELEARTRLRSEDGRQRLAPAAHACRQVRLADGGALRLLRGLSPYEAAHVACGAEVQATCPKCGALHGPVENPLVAQLMRDFPEETTGWNPNFKGFVFCTSCGG